MQVGEKGSIAVSLAAFDHVRSNGNSSPTDLSRQAKSFTGRKGGGNQISIDR